MPGPYTRANPFPAKVAINRSLCGQGSEKDTRHFELDLKGWGLNYEVGDSMTVWPTNDPALVDELITRIGAKREEAVKGQAGENRCAKSCFAIAASRKRPRNFCRPSPQKRSTVRRFSPNCSRQNGNKISTRISGAWRSSIF